MKRVLVAEDDRDLQDIFLHALTKRSFDVQIARDGQETHRLPAHAIRRMCWCSTSTCRAFPALTS